MRDISQEISLFIVLSEAILFSLQQLQDLAHLIAIDPAEKVHQALHRVHCCS